MSENHEKFNPKFSKKTFSYHQKHKRSFEALKDLFHIKTTNAKISKEVARFQKKTDGSSYLK